MSQGVFRSQLSAVWEWGFRDHCHSFCYSLCEWCRPFLWPRHFFFSSPDVHEMLTWLFWRAITNTVYINKKWNKILKCQLPSCTTHVSGVWQSLQGITSLKLEIVSVSMVSRSWWFWQYMYDAGFYVRFAWIALYRWNVSVWIWYT